MPYKYLNFIVGRRKQKNVTLFVCAKGAPNVRAIYAWHQKPDQLIVENPYKTPKSNLEEPGYKPEAMKIVSAAIVFVLDKRLALAKSLAAPLGLYFLVDYALEWSTEFSMSLLLMVAKLAIQTIFAITTHRIILLGEESVPIWGLHTWTKRETYFFLHILILGVFLIPSILLGLVPFVGNILTLVSIAWIVSRLSLVFPAIAIDQGLTFPMAWQLSSNHQLTLVTIVIVLPVVLSIPAIFLSGFSISSVIADIVEPLTTIFTIAALSLVYREVYRIEIVSTQSAIEIGKYGARYLGEGRGKSPAYGLRRLRPRVPVRRYDTVGQESTRVFIFASWFLAIAGMFNGLAHPLLAIAAGGYFPGLVSSPLIGVASVVLWLRLCRAT